MLCQFLQYSKVTQLYIYIYPLFFRFYSHMCHYRVLSRVPCAIQQVLIICFIQWCVYVNPNLPVYPHLSPLVTISLFSTSVTPFLLNRLICTVFLDSTYKRYHMIFVFLWLTSLNMTIFRSIHVTANGIISFFLWLSNIPLYRYITSSLSILPSMGWPTTS